MSYTEYRFYRDTWYPVGPEVNIPRCNLKTLWSKKNLAVEEVLGFYMVYRKEPCNFDSCVKVDVRDHFISVESIRSIFFEYLNQYLIRGSLFVQAQNSLIAVSEAFLNKTKEDFYTHMSIALNMTTGGTSVEDIWTINSIFRNPGFSPDVSPYFRTEEHILPYFSRDDLYFKECLIGFKVMSQSSPGLVSLTQIVNSVTVNGKEFPFKVMLEKDQDGKPWYEDIDPNFFYSDDVKPIPTEMMLQKA